MKNQKMAICLAVVYLMAATVATFAEEVKNGDKLQLKKVESQITPQERAKWFGQARFGMFIHWGLYAVPAGQWKGHEIKGIGEWVMYVEKIPAAEYAQLANQFNPVKFDAEAWAQLAQDAGMKYMVITAKHHDGFSMYDSKATKYDIVDATPFKRDPMKELAAACAKRGIKFGFYYSQTQDWHEKDAVGNTWDWPNEDEKNFDKYFEEKVIPQVRELLTQYGPICLIWFDTPKDLTKDQSQRLVDFVHSIQPACMVSGRVGNDSGDYKETGDNEIPAGDMGGPWESCGTINDTWGYKKNDNNWKSSATLIQNLVKLACNNGNYLLNVGPTAEGIIPEPSAEKLRQTGKWLKENGESIYGATSGPLGELSWGRCTAKPGKFYLHVFTWPADGKLEVPGLKTQVKKAYLLTDKNKSALTVTSQTDKAVIDVSQIAPDPADTVIVLEIAGA